MKWWKRIFFSVFSLAGGFFSLDYQMLAFGLITQKAEREITENSFPVLWQLAGGGMFLIYVVVLVGYLYFVKKNTPILSTYEGEKKEKTGRGLRWEILLQICFLLTGLVLRFGYLLGIYFPSQLS